MTAEISILNRQAVALATDSAVTLQTLTGAPKIYNTNKLFTLSKYQPVGVMIYGNADLMDVPWETIIKSYRANLSRRALATVDDYGKSLLRFIERNTALFSASQQKAALYDFTIEWLAQVKQRVLDIVTPDMKSGKRITKRRLRSVLQKVINRETTHLKRYQVLPRFRKLSSVNIFRAHRQVIDSAISEELKDLATGRLVSKIGRLAVDAFMRDVYWDSSTGLVVAGFGATQHFPSLRCYELSSTLSGRLRYRELIDRRADVTVVDTAFVQAYAQTEMVNQFMEGIDFDYRQFVIQFVETALLGGYPNFIGKTLRRFLRPGQIKKVQQHFTKGGQEVVDALVEEMAKYSHRFHSAPIVQIVNALPKDELAAMAEALVNLTSFKRHITHDAETVGGPIDVAVISRSDGFIWIKRKHYFSKEFNPQFLANYYHDTEGIR